MVTGLWGKKVGMTQIFSEENKVVPVTVIDIANWVITGIKTVDRDGYTAIQVGCIKKKYLQESFSKSWIKDLKKYFSSVKEIRIKEQKEASFEIGQSIDASTILEIGKEVDVFGISKGCGFAGVVRRYNFGGPRGSHGCTMGKKPGSIGSFTSQGKVIKGKKLPGHMGSQKCVMQNLQVMKVDNDAKVVLVKGSIPGKPGSLVFVRKEFA